MNELHEFSIAKFTFSSIFGFPASEHSRKLLKEKYDARLPSDRAADKLFWIFFIFDVFIVMFHADN